MGKATDVQAAVELTRKGLPAELQVMVIPDGGMVLPAVRKTV